MQLSIITPYYDTLKYIKKLAQILEPQLTEQVEWIIIDDGCHEKELDKFKANVIHLQNNSGGAGKPRNVGLDNAKGEYIAFIDSDDLITKNYVEKILERITKTPDIILLSWRSKVHNVIVKDKKLPNWNCSVWSRVYKKEIIGNVRFNENMKIAEDWIFNKKVKGKRIKEIKEQIYIYNNGRKGSLING